MNAYGLHDGRLHAGSINVAWQLHDVEHESHGGFVLVPGGHKASYPCPSNDPGHPRMIADLGLVQPKVRKGDVVFFMGSSTPHGAWAVKGERPRRAALFSIVSRHETLINRPAAPVAAL